MGILGVYSFTLPQSWVMTREHLSIYWQEKSVWLRCTKVSATLNWNLWSVNSSLCISNSRSRSACQFWCKRVEEPHNLKFGAISKIQRNYQNCHIGLWKFLIEKIYRCSFYPRRSKLSLFSLYGQLFPRYGLMLKIAIFGHEAWNLKKSARSCIWTLFLPQKVEIELIFALRAAVSEIWAHFENCHIWAWNQEFAKSSRSCIFTPGGPSWAYFALGAAVSQLQQFWPLISLIN